MRIDLSGYNFVFPPTCACCGVPSQTTLSAPASRSTGKRVIHTTSKSWDFPYCHKCIAHVRAARQAGTVARIVTIASIIATAVVYFAGDQPLFAVGVFIAGVVLAIVAHANLMSKAKAMCASECASVFSAARYFGCQGSCHAFDIQSSPYAVAFMTANQNKLVNVRPEVWQWLHATGVLVLSDKPQSPKIYND